MKHSILLLLMFLIMPVKVGSQPIDYTEYEKEYAFPLKPILEKIPNSEGGTTFSANAVLQDKSGFIWFATPNLGANKYDGDKTIDCNALKQDFTKACTGLTSLFCDSDSNVWMGGFGELVKYDSKYNSMILYNVGISYDRSNYVNSIFEYNDEQLIIASDKGIRLFDKVMGKFNMLIDSTNENLRVFDTCKCNSIIFDEYKNCWIGTELHGIFVLNTNNTVIKNYLHDFANPRSLSHNKVLELFIDSKKNIWVGTLNGLSFLERGSDNFAVYANIENNSSSISDNDIRAICEDKNNNIWAGTRFGGLNKLENDGSFTRYKPDKNDPNSLSNYIRDLFVDNSNVLWICTNDAGVLKIDLEQKKFYSISRTFVTEYSNYKNVVTLVYKDSSDHLWIGTNQSRGPLRFKRENSNRLKFIDHFVLSDSIRYDVNNNVSDEELNLWFIDGITGGRLIGYDKANKYFTVYQYDPKAVFLSGIYFKGSLLIGTQRNGLIKFNLEKRKFENLNDRSLEKLSDVSILSLYLDKQNNLWIGSNGEGLFKYEIEKDTIIHYYRIDDDTSSISSSIINEAIEDSNGNIWFATGRGLNKYDNTYDNFKRYPKFDAGVRGIIEGKDGKFWLATVSSGLCSFDPINLKVKKYDFAEGPPVFWPRTLEKDEDGYIYIGSTNGLIYFHPSEIKDNPFIPNIVLTDFQILNESIKPSPENPFLHENITTAKDITLSYKENVFSFEFAALIYNNPSKNQYAYMMEGFDKDWVYCVTRRNVTYTNLDPGDYVFRVKGSNNDGIWNEEGTSIKITITPPWWQTWWFKSCGAALIFMTVGFGFKKRFNKLKKEKQAQEEFSRKLLASQESERKRIANELHDSIAHDILILKNNVVIAMNNTKEDETKSALSEISEQSSSTLNEVRSISYNLHPHQIEALGITKAIKSMIDKVSKSTNISFILEEDVIDNLFSEENEVYIFRIIQEAINNIIKHSSASEAIIKISRIENSVAIIISDNGKGFSPGDNRNKGSLGLLGISERVKMLGGIMSIESKIGEGARFKIELPVKRN